MFVMKILGKISFSPEKVAPLCLFKQVLYFNNLLQYMFNLVDNLALLYSVIEEFFNESS
jgi:hypothetical protein